MIILQKEAYAKLNLTLDVLGKRPDGYHDLQSVMTCVSLSDTVTIRLDTGNAWRVRSDCPQIPQDEDNLCWKAAKAYFQAAGIPPQGLDVFLEKRIPSQAGMAGGSTDAAAVLQLLNSHYAALSETALLALAACVGSDVPFCLFGGTALAEGRGEILTRLPDLPKYLCFVLVKPNFSVSTPALFRAIDACCSVRRPDTAAMCRAIDEKNSVAIGQLLENVFEQPIVNHYPIVETIRQQLLSHAALGARLTGTGSVVFGIFDCMEKAKQAAAAMRGSYPMVLTASCI